MTCHLVKLCLTFCLLQELKRFKCGIATEKRIICLKFYLNEFFLHNAQCNRQIVLQFNVESTYNNVTHKWENGATVNSTWKMLCFYSKKREVPNNMFLINAIAALWTILFAHIFIFLFAIFNSGFYNEIIYTSSVRLSLVSINQRFSFFSAFSISLKMRSQCLKT